MWSASAYVACLPTCVTLLVETDLVGVSGRLCKRRAGVPPNVRALGSFCPEFHILDCCVFALLLRVVFGSLDHLLRSFGVGL